MENCSQKGCNIICVNSIKGGAGKTTIALSLACTLLSDMEFKYNDGIYRKLDNGEDMACEKEPKVCYIDLDIMGTGAKHIIYGENYTKDDIEYFNTIKQTDDNYEQYINTLEMEGKRYKIDCIIMDDDPEEKNKFINSVRSHTSSVNINVFENRAKELLSSIAKKNIYDYIIIDCAPSYESFSRNIFDYLIKEIQPKHKWIKSVYNLFVSTLDKSHVMNTIASIHNIVDATDNNINIKMVLNDTLNYLDDEKKKDEFINKVLVKFLSLRKKDMEDCGDQHEPSISNFNHESIVIKKYSDIALNMFFGNGKQLNGTKLYECIDDIELVKGLKID